MIFSLHEIRLVKKLTCMTKTFKKAYVLANFGGPRHLDEIRAFLQALLLDRDVIRTPLPKIVHNKLFKKIAKYRSRKIREDYQMIGGKSPIYEDTEWLANQLEESLNAPVLAFHRYLPSTHANFFEQLRILPCDQIIVFPMFPQFCYATTGSVAKFFSDRLSSHTINKMAWVRSYATHPSYVKSFQKVISTFLASKELSPENTFLLFSAHGIPQKFVNQGDPYQSECESSFQAIGNGFSGYSKLLCYQSKFGPGKWIKPYTSVVTTHMPDYVKKEKKVVVVPLSFTSDHIETLFEIEKLYLPNIEQFNLEAFRCPALNRDELWVKSVVDILNSSSFVPTHQLIRGYGLV